MRGVVDEAPDRPDYRYGLALALMNRGALEADRKQFTEQERYTHEAVSAFDRLIADFPLIPLYREREPSATGIWRLASGTLGGEMKRTRP